MSTLSVAYIGLGSNLGDRESILQSACDQLRTTVSRYEPVQSNIYQSAPFGGVSQGEFLNSVVGLLCDISADALLEKLQDIEREHGREREHEQRWGPRTLDLDLLLYSDLCVDTESLSLPHPGIAERNFVLFPLHDVAPELEIRGVGAVSDLMRKCPSTGIERWI